MPALRIGEVQVAYEVVGSGPPLLLLMGLGANRRAWVCQVPVLSRHFTLFLIDNRGVGESDKPPGPYSAKLMADDAVAVLDAMQVESAHVLGVSMGGIIAQELALGYPERVRSLLLVATFPKSSRGMRQMAEQTARAHGGSDPLAGEGRSIEVKTIAEAMLPFVFGMDYWRRAAPEVRRALVEGFSVGFSLEGLLAQVAAVVGHDALERLSGLHLPTLVCHGTGDRLVPFHHGERLAASIPGAQLLPFEGGSHAFFVEQADAFNAAVVEWVREIEEEERELGKAEEAPIEVPIDGVLDLHTFAPAEVRDLVEEYLRACVERGIREARIVHGKGTGTLRRIVHSVLEKHPQVVEFGLCTADRGGWGATRVVLRTEPST
jgi:pimeloyl-ACP methyl ester carboxylesterase